MFNGDFRNHASWIGYHRFCFGFIDHDHTLESTKLAYEMFWPSISLGGVLAFHDFGHPDFPEPKEFLNGLPHRRSQCDSIIAFHKE